MCVCVCICERERERECTTVIAKVIKTMNLRRKKGEVKGRKEEKIIKYSMHM